MQCISFMSRYLTRSELTSKRHSINNFIITCERRTLIDCFYGQTIATKTIFCVFFFLPSAIFILWLQWPTFAHVRCFKILT